MDFKTSLLDLPHIGPVLAGKFDRLGLRTVRDLFYHVPARYIDYSLITKISQLSAGETATIHAKIVSLKNIFSKRGLRMQVGSVEDETGRISVIWFNQPFLIKTLYPGRQVSLSGKVGFFSNRLSLSSPDYEILNDEDLPTLHTGRLVPIYPETSGLSSKWIRRTVLRVLETKSDPFDDFLPQSVLTKYKITGLQNAIKAVHFPKSLTEAEIGRERLAFDEFLNLQLVSLSRKLKWKKNKVAYKLKVDKKQVNEFIRKLPFKLTDSQKKASEEVLSDLSGEIPMNRLLEGDVGSGKTVIAALSAFITFANGYQTVIMAPTQILAEQHFETIKKLLDPFNVRVALITSGAKKVQIGRNDIFIGTHALIHKKVIFDRVATVIIDEQHRFGVEQRQHLVKKSGTPHVLTMTATPIPRTVALATYGDLDLSVLTELPKGRQKITTWVVSEQKRQSAYSWIKKQVKDTKSQVFIVCPLIEDSEAETLADVKSVTTEYKKLQSVFPQLKLGLLHGRLKPKIKDGVLKEFRAKKIDILVTTPVVEVGIDIPNATIMVIEASERFGLAQLHQLRGRVGRSDKKSFCLLFTNFRSGNAFSRLKAMEKNHSGFELAELDLKMRGPGEIFGTAQSGFPELKIGSWSNYNLIKDTKEVAQDIIANPSKYPHIDEFGELAVTN